MKKKTINIMTFAVTFVIIFMTACGTAEEKVTEEEVTIEEEVIEEEAVVEEESSSEYAAGEEVYKTVCMACHMAEGKGFPGSFPPLADSDYLLEDKTRAINQVINGSEGEIVVNGVTYNGVMPPQGDALDDQQIADVLNYVLHSWGNDGETVTLEEVAAAR